jgi:hypothetical protein
MLGAFIATTRPGHQEAKLHHRMFKKYYLKFYSEVCVLFSLFDIQKGSKVYVILGTTATA